MGAHWLRDPKRVLIFNGNRTLIGIVRSVMAASQLTGCNLQSIANVCSGRYISSSGLYFRHIDESIEIELDDLDTLKIQDYDELCGVKREYHTVSQMYRNRQKALTGRLPSMKKTKDESKNVKRIKK